MRLTRRILCGCAFSLPFSSRDAVAAEPEECAVFTPSRQQAISADEALARLKAGNERFVAGRAVNCDLIAQVKQTAGQQAPAAAIVGCIDSRVPPEMIFDQRIGDVFCARVAGPLVNADILGSLEFATAVSGAKLIVMLGHVSCGGIKGAIDGVKLGNLTSTLRNFEPALRAVGRKVSGEYNSHNTALVQRVAEVNIKMTADNVMKRSAVIRKLVKDGLLRIVPAMHDVASGRVSFLT